MEVLPPTVSSLGLTERVPAEGRTFRCVPVLGFHRSHLPASARPDHFLRPAIHVLRPIVALSFSALSRQKNSGCLNFYQEQHHETADLVGSLCRERPGARLAAESIRGSIRVVWNGRRPLAGR